MKSWRSYISLAVFFTFAMISWKISGSEHVFNFRDPWHCAVFAGFTLSFAANVYFAIRELGQDRWAKIWRVLMSCWVFYLLFSSRILKLNRTVAEVIFYVFLAAFVLCGGTYLVIKLRTPKNRNPNKSIEPQDRR